MSESATQGDYNKAIRDEYQAGKVGAGLTRHGPACELGCTLARAVSSLT